MVDKALLCVVITWLGMSQEREASLIQTSYSYCEHELKIIHNSFKWMEKSQDRFTSPEIHNKILSTMALHILREITSELSENWYTIMVDELDHRSL